MKHRREEREKSLRRCFSPWKEKRDAAESFAVHALPVVAAEDEAGVHAAEAEGVREDVAVVSLAWTLEDIVEVAAGAGCLQICCAGDAAVGEGEPAEGRLDRAGRAQGMRGQPLRAGDGDAVGMVAEDVADRFRLPR